MFTSESSKDRMKKKIDCSVSTLHVNRKKQTTSKRERTLCLFMIVADFATVTTYLIKKTSGGLTVRLQ